MADELLPRAFLVLVVFTLLLVLSLGRAGWTVLGVGTMAYGARMMFPGRAFDADD